MRFPVIIAAAGSSTRCPEHKLLKPYHGKPLLQWQLDTLSRHPRIGRILVVTGAQHQDVEGLLYPYPSARIVHNIHWRNGLASSLRSGVDALPPTHGFLIGMGDTPFFSPLTLQQILPSNRSQESIARVPLYRGEEGYPMYFPGETRSEWRHLEGEQGARSLLRRLTSIERLAVDDGGVLQDLNRLDDFPASETLDLASLSR